jgi:hypothetical protein
MQINNFTNVRKRLSDRYEDDGIADFPGESLCGGIDGVETE